jgi:hypothetical protein
MEVVENRNDLLDLFNKNLIIAEIGVFKGDFSKIIYEKMSPKELHLIDIFSGMTCSGDKDGNNIEHRDIGVEYKKIKEWAIDKNVIVHKGYSTDILNTFDDDYFDLIYIDGDHSYEGVKKDMNVSFKKIKNNGYMCGHDYNKNSFPGVVNAVNEFCRLNNLQIEKITKDGCPTFVIKVVK